MSPYSCADDVELFFKRLPRQSGGAITPDGRVYFQGSRRQRGSGLGGVFSAFGRRLIPFARKFILPYAVQAVQSIASDFGAGRGFKESLKDNSMRAFKSAGRDYFNQTGSGVRRKNTGRRSAVKIVGKKGLFYSCGKKRKATKSKPKRKKRQTQQKRNNHTIFH